MLTQIRKTLTLAALRIVDADLNGHGSSRALVADILFYDPTFASQYQETLTLLRRTEERAASVYQAKVNLDDAVAVFECVSEVETLLSKLSNLFNLADLVRK